MSDIDKDIETIKDFIEYSQNMINDMEYERPVDVTIDKKDIQAIENVLKELEIKDKMIDLIAEKLAKKYLSHPLRCTLKEKENIDCCKFKSCTECIKQYFRKWVQK